MIAVAVAGEIARSRSGHGGLALWYLSRWLWHELGWWSLLITVPLGGLFAWIKKDD